MNLSTFFAQNPHVALAFSGGTDSSYLLYAAKQNHCDVKAFFVKTAFQPQFEMDDAIRLAKELDADLTALRHDIFQHEEVVKNPKDRCYYCKTAIFHLLKQEAENAGYNVLIDGTNASDDAGDRPGMKALQEIGVRSPLRECGMTKDEIRVLSRQAGLFTWNKPSYACLATRIPSGTAITAQTLARVEASEEFLFTLGFSDLRIRVLGEAAKLQLPEDQMAAAVKQSYVIREGLAPYFSDVLLDLKPR